MNTRLLKHPIQAKTETTDLATRLTPGAYITDGTDLFRCVSRDDAIALCEDCITLDVIVFTMEDLTAAGVRLVKPATQATDRIARRGGEEQRGETRR